MTNFEIIQKYRRDLGLSVEEARNRLREERLDEHVNKATTVEDLRKVLKAMLDGKTILPGLKPEQVTDA